MHEVQDDERLALTCAGRADDGGPCPDDAHARYEYCLLHLEEATREHVGVKVFDLVSHWLGANRDELSEGSAIVDDLGADSLDVTNLIMAFEEEFGLSLQGRRIEAEIRTVGDAIKRIADFLIMKESYGARRAQGPSAAPRQQQQRAPRQAAEGGDAKEACLTADQVARSLLFRKYFDKLGLDAGEMARIFRAGVGRNLIYHVTPIRKKNEDGTLKLVDVFLLGRSNIYHFLLQRGPVRFEWAPLNDLIITYEIFFDDGGKISRVEVVSRSRSAQGVSGESLRNTELKFVGSQIRGALKFLAKFVTHTEV